LFRAGHGHGVCYVVCYVVIDGYEQCNEVRDGELLL
jgi:hypothetical protein